MALLSITNVNSRMSANAVHAHAAFVWKRIACTPQWDIKKNPWGTETENK
jgi:hypothetical protein